jgi:hypothetical protein
MRDASELLFVVTAAIKASGGQAPFTILAHNAAEAEAIRALLKGKHNAKTIDVRVATSPDEFKPVASRWAEGDAAKFRNVGSALK